jgi:hypothetical protein
MAVILPSIRPRHGTEAAGFPTAFGTTAADARPPRPMPHARSPIAGRSRRLITSPERENCLGFSVRDYVDFIVDIPDKP